MRPTRKTIKSKMMWYHFAVICLAAVFFSVNSYFAVNKHMEEQLGESLKSHVSGLAIQYQKAYDTMRNLLANLTGGDIYKLSALKGMPEAARRRKLLEYQKQLKDACSLSGYGNYIIRLAVLDEEDVLIQAGMVHGSASDRQSMLENDWFFREKQQTLGNYCLELEEISFLQYQGPVIPVVGTLSPDGITEGYVVLCLSPKLYQDILEADSGENQTVAVTRTGKRLAVVHEPEDNKEETDRLISELLENGEDKGLLKRYIGGKNHLIAYEKDPESGVMILEIAETRTLMDEKKLFLQSVFLLFGCCVGFGLALSFVFTRWFNRPIERLVRHINQITEGRFEQDPLIEGTDEIGTIGVVVNDMSAQISELLRQRVEDEREKGELELQMLQAQINPHFLYNTLDSIRWIAVVQNNSGIVKMVTALSGLLRNMAKGFHEKVTVQKELDFLKDYITIQKMKYAELFDVEIQVEEPRLLEAKMLKLTLQPLVENSIINGIAPGEKNGIIKIHIYEKDAQLFLKVWDNGVGIAPEKLQHVLEQANETENRRKEQMSSIGLPNVNRRIRLAYGEDYGLSVDSVEGQFTEVTVKLPLEMKDVLENGEMEANEEGNRQDVPDFISR